MEDEMKLDMWGYEVRTCSDACMSAINSYYHQVLGYGRKRSVILDAPRSDPLCVLGNILAAHFLCSADSSRAPPFIDAAKSCLNHASSYEKAVFDVVLYLISPNRDDDLAVELHSKHLQDFPRDLVSLKRAQIICFYMGRPDLSLKLVEQVLPINGNENYIYGMLAFPLLELGRMEDADEAGKKGYEINKDDPWSQHALCHVYQFDCRFKEAVEFMEECARSWNSLSSFMLTHNWWHVALCYLESQAPMTKVRDVYDHCILKELERSDAVPAEVYLMLFFYSNLVFRHLQYIVGSIHAGLLKRCWSVIQLGLFLQVYLNAVGLLLRVYVRGELDAFGDRLWVLASNLTNQAFWFLEWHLDILIVWALSFTGEFNKAEDLLKGSKTRVSMMSEKKRQLMLRGHLNVSLSTGKETMSRHWNSLDMNSMLLTLR
ncbi:uncharacterized protein [Primulina huaijiensis]|uniref:uncharacterized protein isoform X3 n=1 Tax=Primulina huaijiensis TaxID=1492673 RepID=UPI003CC6DF3A